MVGNFPGENFPGQNFARTTYNFEFLSLKSSSPGWYWGAPDHADIIEF